MRLGVVNKKQKNKDGTVREYLSLVEYIWDKEKGYSKQRHISYLGRTDELLKEGYLDNLVENLCKYTKHKDIVDLSKDIDAEFSKTYGEIVVFRKLWNDLGLKNIICKHFSDSKNEIDYVETIFAMVCNRLVDPCSKRAANEWIKDVYEPEWENFELHHFYRGLDYLVEQKENVETEMFNAMKNTFNCKVDVVMFDTTNISYWGEGNRAEDLLKRGHAKNKRFDLKQVTIGLIMDQNGTPLGHEVWAGNMSDKPAFVQIIDKIKEKYEIGKVIFVADRGMISEDNLKYLEEKNYEYILGVKMRQLSEIRQKILLNDDNFLAISENLKAKQLSEYEMRLQEIEKVNQETRKYNAEIDAELAKGKTLKELKKRRRKLVILTEEQKQVYKNSPKGQRRWVACLNPVMAEIDSKKREYFRQIIENKVEFSTAKEWIVKNGYKKYVIIKDMKIELDREKFKQDELYDGKWALITNTSLPKTELVNAYKDLAAIERHFRDLKSELEVGPVYHHTEKRIKAHIFVCFLALQLKFALMSKLKSVTTMGFTETMRLLSSIKAVKYTTKQTESIIRTRMTEESRLIFTAIGTNPPSKIIS